MFRIDDDMTICITRGDTAIFGVAAVSGEENYKFQAGDVIRFKVTEKKACENVAFYKDFPITQETERVEILLTEDETKIGDVISKPTDYWYEVELNPLTNPQTIIGYDDDGPKVFKLFPEGADEDNSEPIKPEDIPVVDEELDMISTRPVQNGAIARAIVAIQNLLNTTVARFNNLVTLEPGSTTGDAEIADIRVGIDDTVYPRAGDAVREQIRDLTDYVKGRVELLDKNIADTKNSAQNASASEKNARASAEEAAKHAEIAVKSTEEQGNFLEWYEEMKGVLSEEAAVQLWEEVDDIKENYVKDNSVNCISGLKGFYYKAVDKANKIIYLTSNRLYSSDKGYYFFETELTSSVEEDLCYSENAVGKLLSVCNAAKYKYSLTVTKVEPGKIYYKLTGDTDPFETVEQMAEIDIDDFSVWCRDCYDEGIINLGLGSHAEGDTTRATNRAAHAEGRETNAYGQYSHAEGSNTIASGDYSHAEGSNTIASSDYSHAEGFNTKAEYAAHAEGSNTIASGNYSHAEGYNTTASGSRSHAEGGGTIASGNYSHAEGIGTTASGSRSHAEGGGTTASGDYSHAEGYNTKASGNYSHAEGKYNVLDSEKKYAHIVGNGTSDDERSNAHTLDWDGNAEFAGDVIANGCSGASPVSLVETSAQLGGLSFVKLTQAQYDALTAKDPNTIYFTTD